MQMPKGQKIANNLKLRTEMENESIEIRLLLEAIYWKYGYDFRNYAEASLKRRLNHRLALSGLDNFCAMTHRVLYDKTFFETLILDLSINVTEMFRDQHFFKAIRQEIIPRLKSWPSRKVWVAGCSSGEEVYSLAIVFAEEDLYKKTRFYATDFNEVILEKARKGIYSAEQIQRYTLNYQQSGGRNSFSDYYTANYGSALMVESLKDNILFAAHNLVSDVSFNEMQFISCRNVLIYFDSTLQRRVLQVFYDSLALGGFLALGSKESLTHSEYRNKFEEVSALGKIYRKVR